MALLSESDFLPPTRLRASLAMQHGLCGRYATFELTRDYGWSTLQELECAPPIDKGRKLTLASLRASFARASSSSSSSLAASSSSLGDELD